MPRRKEEYIRTCYDDSHYIPVDYWKGEDYYDDEENNFQRQERQNESSLNNSDKALRRMTKEFNKRNSGN